MGLEVLEPIIRLIPEVRKPEKAPSLKTKLLWTLIILLVFFVMYHVPVIGVGQLPPGLELLQVILASKIGSLITVGIGPIVLASIFLQLLVGAKLLKVNLQDPRDRQLFQGTQKLLGIALCFLESMIYVNTGYVPALPGMAAAVILQMAIGSLILLYFDEIVSKYGIGSGISLFIASGVALQVVQATAELVIPNALTGFATGGIPTALLAMLPIVFTIVVFLIVVYAEGMRVEIPISFGKIAGIGGRYPIKFLYVSNIPVIFAAALLINIRLWAKLLSDAGISILGTFDGAGNLVGGIAYFLNATFPNPAFVGYDAYINFLANPTEILHILIYVGFLILLCILFGKFWIETTGLGSRQVASQLENVGFQIPGFRRDPRIIQKVLDKYIPTITTLGSIFVGLLAAFADLTGALGSGTGILLTVGILYRFYEQLASEQLFELYPALKQFGG